MILIRKLIQEPGNMIDTPKPRWLLVGEAPDDQHLRDLPPGTYMIHVGSEQTVDVVDEEDVPVSESFVYERLVEIGESEAPKASVRTVRGSRA